MKKFNFKKGTALFLILMILTLSGCGTDSYSKMVAAEATMATATVTLTPTIAPTPESTETPTPSPTAEPTATPAVLWHHPYSS